MSCEKRKELLSPPLWLLALLLTDSRSLLKLSALLGRKSGEVGRTNSGGGDNGVSVRGRGVRGQAELALRQYLYFLLEKQIN